MKEYLLSDNMLAAIYPDQNNTGNPLDVKIDKITVSPSAQTTKNVLANGAVIHDSKIVLPVEITCTVVLQKNLKSYETSVTTIHKLLDRKEYKETTFSAVRTKEGVLYKNLVLVGAPHDEDTEHYDVFVFNLKFQEYVFDATKKFDPKNTQDKS